MDSSTVSGWVEAIATSGAFLATTSLLYIESRRRRVERRDEIEAAAAKVAHWLYRAPDGDVRILVSNAGPSPVYFVQFHIFLDDVLCHMHEMSTIAPNERPLSSLDLDGALNEVLREAKADAGIRIDLLFTDAQSRNWVRDLNGMLLLLEARRRVEEEQRLRERYAIIKFDRSGATYLKKPILERLKSYASRNLD